MRANNMLVQLVNKGYLAHLNIVQNADVQVRNAVSEPATKINTFDGDTFVVLQNSQGVGV